MALGDTASVLLYKCMSTNTLNHLMPEIVPVVAPSQLIEEARSPSEHFINVALRHQLVI
jgi:hypothetical protein